MTFQGVDVAAINWGLIKKIEARAVGGPALLDVGRFQGARLQMVPLTKPGDPAATLYAYAVKYTLRFDLLQSDAASELALLGSSGLHSVDAEVRITYASGRRITLGVATGYPLRLVPSYAGGDEEGAELISVEAQNIEPIDSLPAKVS